MWWWYVFLTIFTAKEKKSRKKYGVWIIVNWMCLWMWCIVLCGWVGGSLASAYKFVACRIQRPRDKLVASRHFGGAPVEFSIRDLLMNKGEAEILRHPCHHWNIFHWDSKVYSARLDVSNRMRIMQNSAKHLLVQDCLYWFPRLPSISAKWRQAFSLDWMMPIFQNTTHTCGCHHCMSWFGVAHCRPGSSGFHINLHDLMRICIFFILYIMSRIQQGIAQEHPVSLFASHLLLETDQMPIRNGSYQDFVNRMPIKPVSTQRVRYSACCVGRKLIHLYMYSSCCWPDCM